MEEIRALEVIENTEVEEVNVEPESSNLGVIGIVAGGLALAVGAAAVVWHKTKKKREAKNVEKLRKKGYIITEPEDFEDVDDDDDYEIVEDEK